MNARATGITRLGLGFALLLAGCGTNRIIVGVDIASFFGEDLRSASYGGPLPVPPATPVSVPIVAQTVATPRGLDEVAEVEEAALDIRVVFDHQSGAASGSFEIHFAAEGEDPYTQAPAVVLPVTLRAGQTSVLAGTEVLDPDLYDLFLAGAFEVGVRILLETEGVDPVYGSYAIEVLKAEVVTDPDLGS
jgi:hypothetical protein